MQLLPAQRPTVSLLSSIGPNGTAQWTFEPGAFDTFIVEVDTVGTDQEDYTTSGVSMPALGTLSATFVTPGEYRFRVTPVVAGCPSGLPTESGPIQVGHFLYVATPGIGTMSGADPGNAMATIGDAIAASPATDADIYVASTGPYVESLTLTKNLHLVGGFNAAFTARSPATTPSIWRASDSSAPALTVTNAVAHLEGFRFAQAPAPAAPPPAPTAVTIALTGASNTTFDDCEIYASEATGTASTFSMYVYNAMPLLIRSSRFFDLTAPSDQHSAILSFSGDITLEGVTFDAPTSPSPTSRSHAVEIIGGSLTASTSTIHLSAASVSTGISCDNATCNLVGNTIEGSLVENVAIGVSMSGTSSGAFSANSIHGGGTLAGSCTALSLGSTGAVRVDNNRLFGGDCYAATGVEVSAGAPSIVFNAIGAGSDNSNNSHSTALALYASRATIVDNILFISANPDNEYCVREMVPGAAAVDPLTFSYNALLDCDVLYSDELNTDLTTIAQVNLLNHTELSNLPLSCTSGVDCDHSRYQNNLNPPYTAQALFGNLDGGDNLTSTWLDNDWTLFVPDASLRKGGLKTSRQLCGTIEHPATCGGVSVDFNSNPRTCPADDIDCVTIGPHELDL